MNIFKMRLSPMNCLPVSYGNILSSKVLIDSSLLLLLLCLVSLTLTQSSAIGAVDIDTSGDGSAAAAYDGEEGIATDGDSFCSITNDIAGGKFSSLFEGIVGDCDNNNSQISNQFLVEYSYTKNPVEIGEKTYLTITVKDKESGNPISNAFVTLAIEHTPSSLRGNIVDTALAAATTIPAQENVQYKTTQTTYTNNNGHAAFTVQLGPKSDLGLYDTVIEVSGDDYQNGFELTGLGVIPQSQHGGFELKGNNGPSNDGLGAIGGDGGDGGNALGGNAIGGDGGDGGNAIGGDGGDGGNALGGNAIGGDGGDGGNALGLSQAETICDEDAIGGDGGDGGDTINGIEGKNGDNGADEMAIC
jgi:hypothetical protein